MNSPKGECTLEEVMTQFTETNIKQALIMQFQEPERKDYYVNPQTFCVSLRPVYDPEIGRWLLLSYGTLVGVVYEVASEMLIILQVPRAI
jgi:hypothetical protein